MDQKRKEFLDLKQGHMMVTEYEREFVRLSKYAQECVSFKGKICRRFEDGLNEDIRSSVGVLELKEFVVLINRAWHSYRDHKKQDLDSKSRATSVASVGNARSSRPKCHYCGRSRFGKCRMNDGSCFRCDSQDHFIKDCPEMNEKEKFQSTRPSGTNSKGRP
ncbi:uncharacterized protein LOC108481284 [Gossypium arboreum]|uniref:uncharacterized protein LOC108481284 n=1 Tax=Gossypium arboreum TaxID=29729 RepID=UPI0008192D3D|nr:uncharacterized protein LOC108481284 [Gossypium arboreum]